MIKYYIPDEMFKKLKYQFFDDNDYNENQWGKYLLDKTGGTSLSDDHYIWNETIYIEFPNEHHITMLLLKL